MYASHALQAVYIGAADSILSGFTTFSGIGAKGGKI
jgi:hypothetical protein